MVVRTDHDRQQLPDRRARGGGRGAVEHILPVEHPLARRVVEPCDPLRQRARLGIAQPYGDDGLVVEGLQRIHGGGQRGAARHHLGRERPRQLVRTDGHDHGGAAPCLAVHRQHHAVAGGAHHLRSRIAHALRRRARSRIVRQRRGTPPPGRWRGRGNRWRRAGRRTRRAARWRTPGPTRDRPACSARRCTAAATAAAPRAGAAARASARQSRCAAAGTRCARAGETKRDWPGAPPGEAAREQQTGEQAQPSRDPVAR